MVGVKVLMMRLVSPKTPPKNAPFLGPSRIEPIMTGTWIMVALVTPSGIYPRKGVNAITTMMAENSAICTNDRVWVFIEVFIFSCPFLLNLCAACGAGSSMLLFHSEEALNKNT